MGANGPDQRKAVGGNMGEEEQCEWVGSARDTFPTCFWSGDALHHDGVAMASREMSCAQSRIGSQGEVVHGSQALYKSRRPKTTHQTPARIAQRPQSAFSPQLPHPIQANHSQTLGTEGRMIRESRGRNSPAHCWRKGEKSMGCVAQPVTARDALGDRPPLTHQHC